MLNSHNLRMMHRYTEKRQKGSFKPLIILIVLFIILMVIMAKTGLCAQRNAIVVKGWSDNQIVNAIYLAEGGSHARYPYGIRSIKCESKEACRAICKNTVRNNRKRYLNDENYGKITFIEFLGNRFAPTKGNLSKSELAVNKNWKRNVTWFLNHPRSV